MANGQWPIANSQQPQRADPDNPGRFALERLMPRGGTFRPTSSSRHAPPMHAAGLVRLVIGCCRAARSPQATTDSQQERSAFTARGSAAADSGTPIIVGFDRRWWFAPISPQY